VTKHRAAGAFRHHLTVPHPIGYIKPLRELLSLSVTKDGTLIDRLTHSDGMTGQWTWLVGETETNFFDATHQFARQPLCFSSPPDLAWHKDANCLPAKGKLIDGSSVEGSDLGACKLPNELITQYHQYKARRDSNDRKAMRSPVYASIQCLGPAAARTAEAFPKT
jgi:hypothetical protein